MSMQPEFVTVDGTNIEQHGFFCYKSKRKEPGYLQKRSWLDVRFAEGMKLQLVYEGKRSIGFIEYIPGDYAWRALYAPNYMVIHCLWVVGTGKGKGYGTQLLDRCEQDARNAEFDGVAMVTSSGNWLMDNALLRKVGFTEIATVPPTFGLMVKRFTANAPLPTLPQDWSERLQRLGAGLTIFHSAQCPYLHNAIAIAEEVANDQGIATQVVTLQSAEDVRTLSPTPYGVFALVYNGALLRYHYTTKKELETLLKVDHG